MKIRILMAFCLAAAAAPASAQSRADSAAIRATSLDYIDGWYTGNAARMRRSLHPDLLVKRQVIRTPGDTTTIIREMTAAMLVQGTSNGGGTRTPAAQKKEDVRILDIFQNSASVRVDAGLWIDYLHLARVGTEWKIVNVLWETRPQR